LLREENGAAKLRALHRWRSDDSFNSVERLVLEYAEAMTRDDETPSAELIDQLRGFFSEPDLVRLTAWICLENFYSRFNTCFAIEPQGFCVVPEAGADSGHR